MKQALKYIALLLALVFVITGASMVAYATGDDGSGGDAVDLGSGDDPGTIVEPDPAPADVEPDPAPVDVEPDPDPVDPDPIVVDPSPVEEEPAAQEPAEQQPVEQTPVEQEPVEQQPVEQEPVEQEPAYYVEPDYSEDPIWYGDASDYDYNTGDNDRAAGSVSDTTQLFDTKVTNEADVAPNAWTNIALDEKSVSKGAGSFSSIKADSSGGDNGYWILIVGYILIGLAVLGILYFIVATVSARKANQRERRHNAGSHASDSYTSVDALSELDESASGKTTSRRTTGHYADGYDSYSSRRASRADTGEIYIPRRAKDQP